ncbi:MAG: hypothetical protein IPG59_18675 [Candidatus Melainabacteria bacterium]|nr:MAG: hypothetical protein IPG59_18675 [Candidatus Melainabacteria bacterium]
MSDGEISHLRPRSESEPETLLEKNSDKKAVNNSGEENILPRLSNDLKYRRALDLLVSSRHGSKAEQIDLRSNEFNRVILDLKQESFTGFLSFSSRSQFSRGAFLLNQGLCVGCLYQNNLMFDLRSTDESIRLLLNDLSDADAELFKYSLPQSIILPYSALFLGNQLEVPSSKPITSLSQPITVELSKPNVLAKILTTLERERRTATVVIDSNNENGICLIFVHRGFAGASFLVELQTFSIDFDTPSTFVQQNENASFTTNVLPLELMLEDRLGIDLAEFLI